MVRAGPLYLTEMISHQSLFASSPAKQAVLVLISTSISPPCMGRCTDLTRDMLILTRSHQVAFDNED